MKVDPLAVGSLVENRWDEWGVGTILRREEFSRVFRYCIRWHHHGTKFGPHTASAETWESGRDLVLVQS